MVCASLYHSGTLGAVIELKVRKKGPDGYAIVLVDRKGGDATHMANSCWQDGADTFPDTGTSAEPITGTFAPEDSLQQLIDEGCGGPVEVCKLALDANIRAAAAPAGSAGALLADPHAAGSLAELPAHR